MKRNNFSRAINHLKKGGLSESGPTNSMKQVYSDNRGGFRLGRFDPEKIFYPDVDGNFPAGIPASAGDASYIRPAGYWDEGPGTTPSSDWDTIFNADFTYNTDDPRNTDSIIEKETGFVKSPMPPNSRSFILGPLVDSYFHNHGNDNITRIGYIQKDTREFVQLGHIQGRWGNDNDGDIIPQDGFNSGRVWNGQESSFTASNEQFTLAHLQWFHDQLKDKKYIQNAHFFFSGGVSTVFGGGGTGQPSGSTQGNTPGVGPGLPKNAANNGPASMGAGSGGNPNVGNPQEPPGFGPEPNAPYPNPKTNQGGEEGDISGLVDAGLTALGIGLDILAVAAILFPEPGTSALGLARLGTRLSVRLGSRAMSGARNRGLLGLTRIFKGKPKYRPTKARYGGGSTKPDPMDRVLRDIDAAGRRLQQQPRGTNPRGAEVRGPYSDVKAQSRPGSGKYQSQSRNYDPKNNPSFGSRRGTRRFNESLNESLIGPMPTMAPTTPTPTGDTPPSVETISKVNKTADAFADKIIDQYPTDQAADLAVKSEGDSILIAAQDPKVQDALMKAIDMTSELTPEEKQILINNGYDDFVRGGMKGTDWMGDLLTLGVSAVAAKALFPVLVKAGGSLLTLIKTEHGMRAITDAAYKTFQSTGQMPPWYHWAFWKLLPQPLLNGLAKVAGTTPAQSILATEGTAAGKIGLHYILKPAALTTFFQMLITGDQRGAESLLEEGVREAVTNDVESGELELVMGLYDALGADSFENLVDYYGDQTPGFNDKIERYDEITDPEYVSNIENELKELDKNYRDLGRGYDARYDWGGQFTKEMFASSGQSFEEYEALRSQIGFFKGNEGPNKYDQYIPLGWNEIMNARKTGKKPEQFTGIAYEIVSRSYKMDEIMKNPNYPREGRNLYYKDSDYQEATKLQGEYKKIFDEYVNLWEGPGGYDDLARKAWNFYEVSEKLMKEDVAKAQKRKDELKLELENLEKETETLGDEVDDLYDQVMTDMTIDYLMDPPVNAAPDTSQEHRDNNDEEIDSLRPDGTTGPNEIGDTMEGPDGELYKYVPRPGYGQNMWVPVEDAENDDPNTPLGSTDATTLATAGYETNKDKDKEKEQKEKTKQIQKAIANDPDVLKAAKKLGSEGKTYLDYLTGQLPDTIDNDYLGQEFVDGIFKDAVVNSNGKVFVGDNIVGTGGEATYDSKTGKVSIPFNYDFKRNEQEFKDPSKAELMKGPMGPLRKAVYAALGPYSADAQPALPDPTGIVNMGLGAVFSTFIGAAKALGGGKHTPGEVTMDANKLKKLNPALYNQLVKEEKFSNNNFTLSERKVSREKRRKILREVKQPYVLPEVKVEKYKPNFKGKFSSQNTPDVTASKQSDDMVRSKNSAGQVWRTKDKYWAGYETTERMNVLQDRTGHGQMYFDSITSSNVQDYEKITERFRKSVKDKDLQEHLNTIAHEKAMREMQDDYISPFRQKKKFEEQQTMQYDNDPLMKKVAKKLRSKIDYFDKPSKMGYPNDPPPKENELINGMHPKYGKKVDYYKKLDPQSAEAMPPTGDPDIDAEVQKARRLKSVKSVSNNESPELETPLKKRTKKKT